MKLSPYPAIMVEYSCPPFNMRCRWLASKFLSLSSSSIFDTFYSLFLIWRYVLKFLPVLSLTANSISNFHHYILTFTKPSMYEQDNDALIIITHIHVFNHFFFFVH